MIREVAVPNAAVDDMEKTLRYLAGEYVKDIEIIPNFNRPIVRVRLRDDTPEKILNIIDNVINTVVLIAAGIKRS